MKITKQQSKDLIEVIIIHRIDYLHKQYGFWEAHKKWINDEQFIRWIEEQFKNNKL